MTRPSRALAMATVVVVATILVLGCSVAASSGNSSAQRNVITREQIQELGVLTAYDAVRRIRSIWLRPRVSSTGTPPAVRVYMDGVYVGGVQYLENVRIDVIQRLVYYGPSDATTKWGTGNSGGAIEVITRR